MDELICIIDLSAPEILAGILTQGESESDWEFHALALNLPWRVGFQQQPDGSLLVCFGEAFNQLDSNAPNEVRFPELDLYFKEITDAPTLHCLFKAFFEEIFERKLPSLGYETQAVILYVITPHQWQAVHRAQLRQTLKRDFPRLTLKGCLNQNLCTAIYYLYQGERHTEWTRALAEVGSLNMFLFDFRESELTLWKLECHTTLAEQTFNLCDIRRYTDYLFSDRDEIVSAISAFIASPEVPSIPAAIGGFGVTDSQREAIVESVLAHCRNVWKQKSAYNLLDSKAFDSHYAVSLEGGVQLIRLFQMAQLEKPFCFTYRFCFGVRLPDGNWAEIIPKDTAPPCERKRAFRVTGQLKPFYLNLYCGLSLTDDSSLRRIASLEVNPDASMRSNNSMEFIVSVALSDYTKGEFAVLLPQQSEPKSIEFTVPVLMD